MLAGAIIGPPGDPEPPMDVGHCASCGWKGPISECRVKQDGDWESGYYDAHLCPKCEDGGCIDDYDYSPEQFQRVREWQVRDRLKRCPLEFVVRPLLLQGCLGYAVDGGKAKIFVDEAQTKEQAAITVWHELIHLIKDGARCLIPHDETEVEVMAVRLAAAFPEIIDLAGVSGKLTSDT